MVSQLSGDFVALSLLFCIALQDIAQYQRIRVCLLYSFWSSCWKSGKQNKQNKCWAGKCAKTRYLFLPFIRNLSCLQMGLIASYALWAASRSFGVFLLSRMIGGISKGNVSLCTAIIADLGSPKARSKGMVSNTCEIYIWLYWLTFNWFQVLRMSSSDVRSLIKWKHDFNVMLLLKICQVTLLMSSQPLLVHDFYLQVKCRYPRCENNHRPKC